MDSGQRTLVTGSTAMSICFACVILTCKHFDGISASCLNKKIKEKEKEEKRGKEMRL